jgi:hypothetical protein
MDGSCADAAVAAPLESESSPGEVETERGEDGVGPPVSAGVEMLRFPQRSDPRTNPSSPDISDELPSNDVGPRLARRRSLLQVAGRQRGLFTSADARSIGYTASAASRQRSSGNWRPTAAPGVWRLDGLPRVVAENASAWTLWWNADGELTSWSALEVLGLVDADSSRSVHFVRPAAAPGRAVARTRTWRRRLEAALQRKELVLHRSQRPHERAISLDHLRIRPAAEALCVAICYRDPLCPVSDGDADALIARLLARHVVTIDQLAHCATDLGAARVLELVWQRQGRRDPFSR